MRKVPSKLQGIIYIYNYIQYNYIFLRENLAESVVSFGVGISCKNLNWF